MKMPLWFRLVTVALFAALLVPWVLLRDERAGHALERTLAGFSTDALLPLLRARAPSPPRGGEPADGAYRLNGMLVKFRTFPAPLGVGKTFGRFQRGLAKAGYVTRTVAIDGRPILLGIHPLTRVMLSVRFATDRRGRSSVRVAQENLAELDPAFRVELPGVPVHPDATGRVLLEPVAGEGARSLTYSTGAAASSVRRFYLAEMERAGWTFLASPFEPDAGALSVLFFTRDDSECSIVLAPAAGASGTMVLVNLGGITERRS